MRLSNWMVAGALVCGAAQAQTPRNEAGAPVQAQPGTQDRSPAANNSAVRAAEEARAAPRTDDETARFAQVPGGPATSRKDWKKGDPRGKPQDPAQARRSRRHRRPHKKSAW